MMIIFLPPCADLNSLHKYMKTNYQIEETNCALTNSVQDANGNVLQGSIIQSPMFSANNKYQIINWNKERVNRKWGNGCSNFANYCIVVLPDGYSLTQAQVETIAAYAAGLPEPV